MWQNKRTMQGITLIALVITVILLLILASIAMVSLFGENGVIAKAVKAREEHNLNQYKEEIGLIVAEEITERQTEEKLEPMIKSLEDKIKQKNWVKENGTSKYNENMIPIPDEQAQEGKYLIIESKEGYEFILEVDNEKETAKLITANKETGKKYKITYNLNGGEGEIPCGQEVRHGFSILLPENTGAKQDYIFVGWSTDKSGNSTPILAGGEYLPQGEEDEITLYAIWSYNVVTITFDGNGATGGSMTSKKATKGENSTLTKNQFIKDGYEFIGWTKTKGSTTKEYDDGGTINTKEDITLYAIWQRDSRISTPKLASGMTAVFWNQNNVEIDQNDSRFNDEDWYCYKAGDNVNDTKQSRWANAKTSDGSYWVWIPRYEYKILSGEGTSTAGKIEVKFIPVTQTTPDSGYKIHPAFQNGKANNYANGEWKKEISGIWVAKFEASNNSGKPQFKPGIQSWRFITTGDCYTNGFNYDRSKESHLMKNSEWGAVAYLAHSQYGRNGKEITINESSSFYTGGNSGDSYKTNINQSTTGNITGIYDINGGSWEWTAGYVAIGDLSNGASFADGTSNEYKTAYPYSGDGSSRTSNYNEFKKSRLARFGDAILETSSIGDNSSSWFNDCSMYPSKDYPFMLYGGAWNDSTAAGSFCFLAWQGQVDDRDSFRAVLITE